MCWYPHVPCCMSLQAQSATKQVMHTTTKLQQHALYERRIQMMHMLSHLIVLPAKTAGPAQQPAHGIIDRACASDAVKHLHPLPAGYVRVVKQGLQHFLDHFIVLICRQRIPERLRSCISLQGFVMQFLNRWAVHNCDVSAFTRLRGVGMDDR